MVIARLLSEVVEGLRARPEVEALLFESGTLHVCLSSPLAAEARQALLAPRSTVLDVGAGFWEPEDDGEFNDGTSYKLVYRSLDDWADKVARVVEKAQASLGGTTCLWNSLTASELLFDRTGRARTLQARFQTPFPAALQSAIVAKNWPVLTLAAANHRDQVVKALKQGDWITVQRRVTAFFDSAFDLVFAANATAQPGDAALVTRTTALPALPSDWSALVAAVDKANAGARAGLADSLDRLAAAIEVFLVRQGLLAGKTSRVPAMKPTPSPQEEKPAPSGPLSVYTDGGCIGNPGKGAWAFLVDDGVLRVEDTAGEPMTTNNKMELQAVISALAAISARQDWAGRSIRIHTDSQYVRNGITAWIKTWSSNGWKTAAKEPVKNQDLWMELQRWDQALKPEWKWVKGHAGNPNNERCDALVRRTMDQM